MGFYVVEKWPGTEPGFVMDEDGVILVFSSREEAEEFSRKEINFGTVVELP